MAWDEKDGPEGQGRESSDADACSVPDGAERESADGPVPGPEGLSGGGVAEIAAAQQVGSQVEVDGHVKQDSGVGVECTRVPSASEGLPPMLPATPSASPGLPAEHHRPGPAADAARRQPVRRGGVTATKWLAGAVATGLIGWAIGAVLSGTPDSGSSQTSVRSAATGRPGAAAKPTYSPVRPVFWCQEPSQCYGPDHPAINSFINTVNYGDERSFFDARRADASGSFANNLTVYDGETIRLRIYYANSARPPRPATSTSHDARNVRVRVALPRRSSDNAIVSTAYLSGSNTAPKVVADGVQLSGERPFRVSYVRGSAQWQHRPDGKKWVTEELPDSIVAGGASIGDVGWSFSFSGFVTLEVRVAMPPAGPVAEVIPAPDAGQGNAALYAGPRRPSFRCDGRSSCPGPPYVALNSFTNDPVLGNEWSFLRGQTDRRWAASGGVTRYETSLSVQPGDMVRLQAQISNNFDAEADGPPGMDPRARGLRGIVLMPSGEARSLGIIAYVRAANAEPKMIYSDLMLRSGRPIRLRYSKGSAFFVRAASPTDPGESRRLPDRLVVRGDRGHRMLPAVERGRAGVKLALGDGDDTLRPGARHAAYIRFSVEVLAG